MGFISHYMVFIIIHHRNLKHSCGFFMGVVYFNSVSFKNKKRRGVLAAVARWGVVLCTEGSLVQFPFGAHAHVVA